MKLRARSSPAGENKTYLHSFQWNTDLIQLDAALLFYFASEPVGMAILYVVIRGNELLPNSCIELQMPNL